MIDKLVGSMTAEEVFHRSQAKGLLWASVRTPEENIADPHFQARGSFQTFDSPEPGHPLYYPVSVATDGQNPLTTFEHAAPRLGEHNSEVLRRFGLSDAEIKELSAAGAI
jgi:formyl-CoA transferase